MASLVIHRVISLYHDDVIDQQLLDRPLDDSIINLVSRAAALHGPDGNRDLGIMANLGDACITKALARRMVIMGDFSRAQFQNTRSSITTNAQWSKLLIDSGFVDAISFVSAAGPETKAGADAFEAIVGMLSFSLDDEAMDRFLWHVGLYALCSIQRLRSSPKTIV